MRCMRKLFVEMGKKFPLWKKLRAKSEQPLNVLL